MIADREIWACAAQVLRQYGARAEMFIADRIADLAARGDDAGVGTWRAIADRLKRLRDIDPPPGAH